MPRIRIPMKDWIKQGAKNKHKFIPEGQREVSMIFAPDVIFIDTEYLLGHEPEPIEEPAPVEEPVEPTPVATEKTPDETWTKKKLIKQAKKQGVYTKNMQKRSYTKAKILKKL